MCSGRREQQGFNPKSWEKVDGESYPQVSCLRQGFFTSADARLADMRLVGILWSLSPSPLCECRITDVNITISQSPV